jgi:hypothetical protein
MPRSGLVVLGWILGRLREEVLAETAQDRIGGVGMDGM